MGGGKVNEDLKEKVIVAEESGSDRRYLRNPDVVVREEDIDGALIFNPDTNQIRVLNVTGFFVWQSCDGTRSASDIIESLKGSFDGVPEDQVIGHVTEFIDDLMAAGFIGIPADWAGSRGPCEG